MGSARWSLMWLTYVGAEFQRITSSFTEMLQGTLWKGEYGRNGQEVPSDIIKGIFQ